ncbi:MAG: hypothetical protein D6750_05265 [Bacteroidetes bacterium]|nr:MAG: hypothetical protein D6750_05265 [Bacteroidota bacterium]
MGYTWPSPALHDRQSPIPAQWEGLSKTDVFLRAKKIYFAPRRGVGWFFAGETFSWSFLQSSLAALYLPARIQVVPDSHAIRRSIACRGVEVGLLGRWMRSRWGVLSSAGLYLLSTRVNPLSLPLTDGGRFFVQPTLNTFVGLRLSVMGMVALPDDPNLFFTFGLHWPFLWGRPAPILARRSLPDGSTLAQSATWYLPPHHGQVSLGLLFKSPF